MFSLLADVPLTGAVVLEWFIYIYYIIIYIYYLKEFIHLGLSHFWNTCRVSKQTNKQIMITIEQNLAIVMMLMLFNAWNIMNEQWTIL